ncbi:MAG: chemotaxis protein CheB [Candidatus Hydrogenedentes bacterium]|nr:chemotaxis protein CheB [Candidatus Hydrogenedentota bacterium]MBI5657187.1 chemotaxis protein CheB [Geobacter sp.]
MSRANDIRYRAIVAGVSMGGVEALRVMFGGLPGDFPLPLLVVHHTGVDPGSELASILDARSAIRVKEADDEEVIRPGTAYLAPANYHLLVEKSGALALSVDPPVNFARPSVDVLFESAATAFGSRLIGVILTGAGSDGSRGLKAVQDKGGVAIVQDPADAEADSMPRGALAVVTADHVLPLKNICGLLCSLAASGAGKTDERR